MTELTVSPQATTHMAGAVSTGADPDLPDLDLAELDLRRVQRTELMSRHSQSLTRLMEQRADLRGVHALADFVDESIRWTA